MIKAMAGAIMVFSAIVLLARFIGPGWKEAFAATFCLFAFLSMVIFGLLLISTAF